MVLTPNPGPNRNSPFLPGVGVLVLEMETKNRSIDMLSGLPDELLCHILSFVSTWGSVRTSVLAKRWRFLWAHVPNLEFYGLHLDDINRVIMLHEAKIVNTFRLSEVKVCANQLETLLIYIIRRGVRNVYLEFNYEYGDDIACTVPRFLFFCKTLVDLKLVNCGVIPSSGKMFLPSLKKLNLSFVEYEDDKSLPHLLSGCPVLEELTIHDTFRKGQKNSGCIIVSSPTIKTLNVEFAHGGEQNLDEMLGGEQNLDEMLIIDVPVLVYLKVEYCDLERVKSLRKTMTSLIEVDITLNGDWHYCEIDCTKHGCSIEFLRCLSHVRYLKLSNDLGDPFVGIVGTGSMPKFVNLTKLVIEGIVNWYNLVKFLEDSDHLEVLIMILCYKPSYEELELVPPCMLSSLRSVEIILFNGWPEAFDIVSYILRNAQVLETMEIDPWYKSSDEEKFETLETLSYFECVSESCQVSFLNSKCIGLF